MSNIPEKENQVENIETEESTIFSNPVEHSKKAENIKKKRLLPTIICSFLAVAVLVGGTFAIIKLIPEKQQEEIEAPILEEIPVLEYTIDDFSPVKVKNENGEFEFYRAAMPDGTNTGNWYLKGYDIDVISPVTSSAPPAAAAQVYASREITKLSLEECGLDKPLVEVAVTTLKDGEFTIFIGAESADQSGRYIKLSDSDKIYLVKSDFYYSFVFNALDFASESSLPIFDLSNEAEKEKYIDSNGNLICFDKLTITGNKIEKPIEVSFNTDERFVSYVSYIVTSPSERIADNDAIDSIFSILQPSVTNDGAYSYDTSKKTLAEFGLDKPDIELKVEVLGKTMTYSFKLQQDGNYAVMCTDAKFIRKIAANKIAFAEYTASDFYSSWVALVSIDDIESFTLVSGDKTYKFDIATIPPAEGETANSYAITYNGREISEEAFKDFYQVCISLPCTDYVTEKLTDAPIHSLIYDYKNSDNVMKVDFIKSGETKYQYRLNGVDMGKVNTFEFKKLVTELEALIAE